MDKLHEFVAGYQSIAERASRDGGIQRASISWRAVRFVGEFDGRTVTDPLAHGDPSWVRRLHTLLHDGALPASVAPCTTIVARGKSLYERAQYVVPTQIDWTGYRHAGGDAARRSRSGPSGPTTPESERDRVQVKLSLGEDDARDLRELAQRRGVTVSALVAELVRDAS